MHIYEINDLNYWIKKSDRGAFAAFINSFDFVSKFTQYPDFKGVKVFTRPMTIKQKPIEYVWGFDDPAKAKENDYNNSLLVDASYAQRILHKTYPHMVPDIYKLGTILDKKSGLRYPFQLVDDANHMHKYREITAHAIANNIEDMYAMNKENSKVYPIVFDVNGGKNLVNGYWVDFQGWKLSEKHVRQLLRLYKKKCRFAGNLYQSDIIKSETPRRTNKRYRVLYKYLNKDNIFLDKSVLDFGCSGGQFARLASKFGAESVALFDIDGIAYTALQISELFCYFNLHEVKRAKATYDVLLYLSMARHTGYPEWIFSCNTIVYEHNGDMPENDAIKMFEDKGYESELLGRFSKHDSRGLYILRK